MSKYQSSEKSHIHFTDIILNCLRQYRFHCDLHTWCLNYVYKLSISNVTVQSLSMKTNNVALNLQLPCNWKCKLKRDHALLQINVYWHNILTVYEVLIIKTNFKNSTTGILLKSRGRFHAENSQFSTAACVFLVRRARTNAHGGGIAASAAGWAWLTSNATSICRVVSVSRASIPLFPFHGLMPVRYRSAIWWDRVNFATAPASAPAVINKTIRDAIDRGAISQLHSLMHWL